MFYYRFDIYVDGRTIPAELEIMKMNAQEHDAVIIDITPGDTASKVKVSVHGKGIRDITEQFDIIQMCRIICYAISIPVHALLNNFALRVN